MTNITGIVLIEKYTALEFFKNMNSGQKSNWLVHSEEYKVNQL